MLLPGIVGMSIIKKIIIAMIASGCLFIYDQYETAKGTPPKPDNAVEETVEAIIKYETGLDIDLTPKSPEQEEIKNDGSK